MNERSEEAEPRDVETLQRCTQADAEYHVRRLLQYIGEDPYRSGLKETPGRVARALKEMTLGYNTPIDYLFKEFEGENYNQMIVVPNIDFTSLCEHHLLPFVGVAHVAYIPNGPIIGLSKLARVVDAFAHRLQVQERMTQQICDAMTQYIPNNKGAACIIEAHHSCMSCRGVRKSNAIMSTTALSGVFEEHSVREEFFLAIARNKC